MLALFDSALANKAQIVSMLALLSAATATPPGACITDGSPLCDQCTSHGGSRAAFVNHLVATSAGSDPEYTATTAGGAFDAYCSAALLAKDGANCGSQLKNLGTAYETVDKCAAAAAADAACSGWTIAYPKGGYWQSWGCRCCAGDGSGGQSNANWMLYNVTAQVPAPPLPSPPPEAPPPPPLPPPAPPPAPPLKPGDEVKAPGGEFSGTACVAVSYTHLTLPTIYSV